MGTILSRPPCHAMLPNYTPFEAHVVLSVRTNRPQSQRSSTKIQGTCGMGWRGEREWRKEGKEEREKKDGKCGKFPSEIGFIELV